MEIISNDLIRMVYEAVKFELLTEKISIRFPEIKPVFLHIEPNTMNTIKSSRLIISGKLPNTHRTQTLG